MRVRPGLAPPSLHACFYVSRAARPLGRHDVERIAWQSARSNWRDGVTGAMVCTGTHFAQWLEGPTDRVQALVARIARDPRHTAMQVLCDQPVPRRLYGLWNMRCAWVPSLERLLDELPPDPGTEERAHVLRAFLDTDAAELEAPAFGFTPG